MLINVLDAAGVAQKLVVHGQEAAVDRSGIITATGAAQSALAANVLRSGYMIHNRGVAVMYVNDLGAAAVAVSANAGSFMIQPGATFPPPGYPLTTGEVSIMGTINDGYMIREW